MNSEKIVSKENELGRTIQEHRYTDDGLISEPDERTEVNHMQVKMNGASNDKLEDSSSKVETKDLSDENEKSDSDDGNDEMEDANDDDDLVYLPIDKGWAWAILAGATFQTFLYGGLMKSYGVFFVEFQKRFGSNASETNVMQTIHNIILSLSGVLISNVGMKYISPRKMVFVGGILTFISYLISAFITDIRVMSLTMGFMAGVSNAMMFLPFVATIGTYFKKHRGLANSLHVSGSSIGNLVFGPFYTALFDSYGYTGTMMLVAGILLNCVVGGALIRPISFYRRQRKWKEMKDLKLISLKYLSNNDSEREPMMNEIISKNLNEKSSRIDRKGLNKCKNNSTFLATKDRHQFNQVAKECAEFPNTSSKNETEDHITASQARNNERTRMLKRASSIDPDTTRAFKPSPTLGRLRANTHSERTRTVSETLNHSRMLDNLLESISRSKIALYASGEITCETNGIGQVIANEVLNADTGDDVEKEELLNSNKTCIQHIIGFLKSVFDISVFGAVFVHYMCFAVFSISGSIMMSVYLIPYAKEVGATSADVSIIFVVISCVDLTSRIFTGFIADRKWLKPTTIVAIDYIIIGVMCHLIRLFTHFWSLILFAIIQGACGGCYICLYNVILIEHMGLDKFKSCIGFTVLFHGMSIAVFYQITGMLRDTTGSYYSTYHLIGAILLLASILSLTLPLTSALVKKR